MKLNSDFFIIIIHFGECEIFDNYEMFWVIMSDEQFYVEFSKVTCGLGGNSWFAWHYIFFCKFYEVKKFRIKI
jgi:hypothetical protein